MGHGKRDAMPYLGTFFNLTRYFLVLLCVLCVCFLCFVYFFVLLFFVFFFSHRVNCSHLRNNVIFVILIIFRV